jgi:diguanylate cyclase (GGDEF)-like protein/PAS domain S-box-containing protein
MNGTPSNVTALPLGVDGQQHDGLPRILLVDDEPRLLSSLHDLLQGRDYQLVTATCGSEALAQLSRLHFDLVLLDLRLPDMSGHDVMDFINARSIDADVIVMSGEVGIDAAIGALKRGAYDYLRKPYSREELLKTVDNALRQRRLELANRRIASQLENSEKLYRYLVDSSPDIIYTLNHEGRFTFVNDRAYQLLGFSREDLIGKHYSILVHEEDLERARYAFNERRIDERASRNVELRLKCHAGGSQDRTFNNTLMTISLNSIGMHIPDNEVTRLEFFGTYGVARDITDRKRAEELISYQAYHDILTDLPNRMLFKDRLGLAVIQAKRKMTELAVMFIDLDRFKLVNDTLGHVKGDELLQQASVRLKECLRRGDTLARQGGDEFTIVLPELRDREDAKLIAGQERPQFLSQLDARHLSPEDRARAKPAQGARAERAGDALPAADRLHHRPYHRRRRFDALEPSGARPADGRGIPAVCRRKRPDAADFRLDDRRPVPRYAAVECQRQ